MPDSFDMPVGIVEYKHDNKGVYLLDESGQEWDLGFDPTRLTRRNDGHSIMIVTESLEARVARLEQLVRNLSKADN